MSRPFRRPRRTFDEILSMGSRLSIAILSSMLLGMTTGDALSRSTQSFAGAIATLGMFLFFCRLLVVRQSHRTLLHAIRRRTESRLDILVCKLRNPRPVAALSRLTFS